MHYTFLAVAVTFSLLGESQIGIDGRIDPSENKSQVAAWTWYRDPFLPPFWQDVIGILGLLLGVVGFGLTLWGLWMAYDQLRRTSTAAKAATKAAVDATNRLQAQYNKYVIAQSSRLLDGARNHVNRTEWAFGAMRIGDLADLLFQVAGNETTWVEFARRLQDMEHQFHRVDRGEIEFDGFRAKWYKLDRELRSKLSERFGPFPASMEGDLL